MSQRDSEDSILPSLDPLQLRLSPEEVVQTFHEPFTSLIRPSSLRPHAFRGGEPYYAIDVTQKMIETGVPFSPASGVDEVGGSDRPGRLEIWGLTGWYTNLFLRLMGLYSS